MANPADILAAASRIARNPCYRPVFDSGTGKLIRTFCNVAVWDMAESVFRCTDLWLREDADPLPANRIYAHALASWREISRDDAVVLATGGAFVIAAQMGEPNGHVVTCLPGPAVEWSGKWGSGPWPLCVNVGRHMWTGDGVNQAFITNEGLKFFLWPLSAKDS